MACEVIALRQRVSRSRKMIVGVAVTGGLLLLLALSERAGGFQWTIALAAGSVTVICACLAALAGGMPA